MSVSPILFRQHNNTNPITNEPLSPSDLITLNYSKKASGEFHDPISFKPFNEHSHIVAIATTGNVFLADSIKGGKDLLDDVNFKKYVPCLDKWLRVIHTFFSFCREDVVTLQNPHGLPSASVPSTSSATADKRATTSNSTKPTKTVVTTSKVKEKEKLPCPYLFNDILCTLS